MALVIATAVVVVGCRYAASDAEMATTTSALAVVLPTLSDLQVATFRDQDWCRNIEYAAGFYSSEIDDETACNLRARDPRPFDEEADAAWQRVHDATSASGLKVPIIDAIAHDDSGGVVRARFYIEAGPFGGSNFYLYGPWDTWSHESEPGELEFTQVDDAWWLGWEDWN